MARYTEKVRVLLSIASSRIAHPEVAAAQPARHYAFEVVRAFDWPLTTVASLIENALHLLESCDVNQRVVFALIVDALENDDTDVVRIAQSLMDLGHTECLRGISCVALTREASFS